MEAELLPGTAYISENITRMIPMGMIRPMKQMKKSRSNGVYCPWTLPEMPYLWQIRFWTTEILMITKQVTLPGGRVVCGNGSILPAGRRKIRDFCKPHLPNKSGQ